MRLPSKTVRCTCAVAVCASVAASAPLAEQPLHIGSISYENVDRALYVSQRDDGESMRKYFLSWEGDTIELRDYWAQRDSVKRARYGAIGLRLYDMIASAAESERFETVVRVNEPRTTLDRALTNKQEAYESRLIDNIQASEAALASIRAALGADSLAHMESTTNLAKRRLGLRLSGAEIRAIASLDEISSIALRDDSPLNAVGFMNRAFGAASNGGLGFSSLSSFGQYRRVAVIEPGSIDTALVRQYMSDVPLAWSLGSGGGGMSADTHAVYVASIIRNSIGSASTFTKGGAYDLDSMLYSTVGTMLSTFTATLNWCDTHGARIINQSWGVRKYQDSTNCILGNKVDWLIDEQSVEDYILHVMAAGNNGKGSYGYNQCVNTGTPGWDSVYCERILHWGHNMLSVGSIDNCTNGAYAVSSYSSWRDGPTYDEVPHVVAIGDSVDWPWSSDSGWNPSSGTSYSAPAITALAANICDIDGLLAWYPEVLKPLIIASASHNDIDGAWGTGWDKKAGAGLPSAAAAASIANNFNRNPGSVLMTTKYGCLNWSFPSSASAGDSLVYSLVIDESATYDLDIFATWMSHPDHVSQGDTITSDDIDMYVVRNNGAEYEYGLDAYNTTEAATVSHPSGTHVYRIKLYIYARRSTSNHNIYGGLVWRKAE